jgi:hypothetical protein
MKAMLEFMDGIMREILKIPAQVAAYVALTAVIIGAILAFGGFSPLFSGFARQSYVLNLNRKLTTRIEHLSTQATTNYAEIRREQRAHWAQDIAGMLLRQDIARCNLRGGPLKSRYDKQIGQEMQSYYTYTGKYYPLPSCRNL